MFSFHKPKIYRSTFGCCICRAKSSSSRFTLSSKYEETFDKCFRVKEGARTGDICNACVLLVKRWKKLPAGTQRDWSHVVDARAGPGTKSLKGKGHLHNGSSRTKSDKYSEDMDADSISRTSTPDSCSSDDEAEEQEMDDGEGDQEDKMVKSSSFQRKLLTNNRFSSQVSKRNILFKSSLKRKNAVRRLSKEKLRLLNELSITSYLDSTFWKMEKICCGIIFKGPDNELLVCPQLLKPCACRSNISTGNGSLGSKSAEGSSSPHSSISSHPIDTSSHSSESADDIKNLMILDDDLEESKSRLDISTPLQCS